MERYTTQELVEAFAFELIEPEGTVEWDRRVARLGQLFISTQLAPGNTVPSIDELVVEREESLEMFAKGIDPDVVHQEQLASKLRMMVTDKEGSDTG